MAGEDDDSAIGEEDNWTMEPVANTESAQKPTMRISANLGPEFGRYLRKGSYRGFNPIESVQSPLRMLARGHTIKLPEELRRGASGLDAHGGVIAGLSDADFNDIDEQVQILELAIGGKFDNRKSIRTMQGIVDFCSHEDSKSASPSTKAKKLAKARKEATICLDPLYASQSFEDLPLRSLIQTDEEADQYINA